VRILVIHTFYKLPGGEDAVVQNEIALLREDGHEVKLLSFSNTGMGLAKLALMPYNLGAYRTTAEKLSSFKPDVVHLHNLHFAASPSVIRAIHKAKIPMVMTIHNYRLLCPSASLYANNQLFLDSLHSEFPWKAVSKGVYQNSKLITFWLAFSNYLHRKIGTWKMIDRFIFLSEHSKQLFLDSTFGLDSQKAAIKPNFALETKSSDTPPTEVYFLYVGRLTLEKGVMTLLEAFTGSEVPLKIAGMGPLDSVVQSYAKDNINIEYLGQQSREGIERLLAKATAVIFPSLWYETFGMIVAEAFANGVPVITSDMGNMKILVTNGINGKTFTVGDSKHLRECVGEFLKMSEEDQLNMRRNARQTFEQKYSPESNLKALLGIYSDSINNSKLP
jgi:glycosyltransferase involved in cell wall biosynthesis